MTGTLHNFSESLARSQQYADAPWWFAVYEKAFPNLRSAVNVRADGWAQRGGIDRVLTLACGRTITVDEKVREKDWPDILLEHLSDAGRRTAGWISKDLACDFIAYAFVPSRRCYLLPTQTLQRAWRTNGAEWWKTYPKIKANNGRYITVSVAIPIEVLLKSLNDAMLVVWQQEAA